MTGVIFLSRSSVLPLLFPRYMRNCVLCIAVITSTLVLSGSRLPAQSASDSAGARPVSSTIEIKSGKTATILSAMLPGLGHLYAEDRRTGVVLMALFAGAVKLGIAGENSVTGPIPMLLGAGPWWYGVLDAHNAVTRYNHTHTANAANYKMQPAMMVAPDGTVRFGIAIHLNY
jgi:hypothetical protein